MGTFKFTYDDDNLKEIKVICKYDDEKDRKDLLDTIKTFCIDSIPEELQPEVTELEEECGYLVKCKDEETGEKVISHIFKYLYLVTRMAMIFKDELSNNMKVEEFDFSLLHPDIEKVENLGYRELISLIGEIEKEEDHVED
jgi:hypothetical protein